MTPSTPPGTGTIQLDPYEVANLREGLIFLRSVGGDTGDWLRQILWKLDEMNLDDYKPNKTEIEQRRDLALRVGWKGLFS